MWSLLWQCFAMCHWKCHLTSLFFHHQNCEGWYLSIFLIGWLINISWTLSTLFLHFYFYQVYFGEIKFWWWLKKELFIGIIMFFSLLVRSWRGHLLIGIENYLGHRSLRSTHGMILTGENCESWSNWKMLSTLLQNNNF